MNRSLVVRGRLFGARTCLRSASPWIASRRGGPSGWRRRMTSSSPTGFNLKDPGHGVASYRRVPPGTRGLRADRHLAGADRAPLRRRPRALRELVHAAIRAAHAPQGDRELRREPPARPLVRARGGRGYDPRRGRAGGHRPHRSRRGPGTLAHHHRGRRAGAAPSRPTSSSRTPRWRPWSSRPTGALPMSAPPCPPRGSRSSRRCPPGRLSPRGHPPVPALHLS